MSGWLANLEARDLRALGLGLVLVAGAAGYQFIWRPLGGQMAILRAGIDEQRKTLAWMRQAAAEIEQVRSRARTVPAGAGSLMSAIDATTKKMAIDRSVRQIEPDGAAAARVWFSGVLFDDLIRWLQTLQDEHGVRASEFSVTATDAAGRVDARMTLAQQDE